MSDPDPLAEALRAVRWPDSDRALVDRRTAEVLADAVRAYVATIEARADAAEAKVARVEALLDPHSMNTSPWYVAVRAALADPEVTDD